MSAVRQCCGRRDVKRHAQAGAAAQESIRDSNGGCTRGIRHVDIAGVSTKNSVEATARTAGNPGLSTVVVADACLTFDKTDFGGTLRRAEEVHLMAFNSAATGT
jgi:nicotinamidase-related amidase